jgi:hypothetical protein
MAIELESHEIEPIIREVIDKFLIPRFRELEMSATGEWERTVEARGNQIWGRHYTEQLENGRPGGSLPPFEAIKRWGTAKFGQIEDSHVWAIMYKIKNEGTNWYPEGSDLLEVLNSTECRQFVIEQLRQVLINKVRVDFVTTIRNALK